MDIRYSDEVPSFLEARPPLIQHPFMRPRPVKGINLLEKFEEDSASDIEDPELVQVYLRMKPCKIPNNLYELRSDKCLVTSLDTTTAGHGRRTQHNVSKMYSFTRIFKPDCSQKEVFERVVKDNMKRLIDGYSFTLLTYGASGSGKTYTLMGTVRAPGLVPRALEYLFKLVDAAQTPSFKPSENGTDQLSHTQQDLELQWVKRLLQISAPFRDKYRRMSAQLINDLTISSTDIANRKKHYIWVSFVEIYNEAVYDLLAPPDKRVKLRLREDSTGNVYVKNVTQAFVRSGEEAYDVMVAGKHNLVVAETGIHAQSSRSHCIFTITMLTQNEGEIRTSHMRFCDLAGCERQRSARNTGTRMLESRAINSSLHVLERCLHMLRRKQLTKESAMVPYRESKLTRILGSGLSGSRGEAVTMVVTVNPAPQYAHETRHVLSLAVVAKDIHVNTTIDPTVTMSSLECTQNSTIQDYQDEVQRLRTENERLHFELLQAQSCCAQLRNAMEEKQQKSATKMMELVEETKDMMRQFYEKQLANLRSQMKEMEEEYETTLTEMKQELWKLTRESKEMNEVRRQNLPESNVRGDDKNENDELLHPDIAYGTDSENESETETDLDESLEPVKQLRKSFLHKDTPEKREPVIDLIHELSEDESENDMTMDSKAKTIPEIKSNGKGAESYINNDLTANVSVPILKTNHINLTIEEEIDKNDTEYSLEYSGLAENDKSECEAMFNVSTKLNKTQEVTENTIMPTNLRESCSVRNESQEEYDIDLNLKTLNVLRGTYFIPNREMSFYKEINSENPININEDTSVKNKESPPKNKESSSKTEESLIKNKELSAKNVKFVKPKKIPETLVSKIMKSYKKRQNSEISLKQFEQLELAVQETDNSTDAVKSFEINIPMHIRNKAYFDDTIKDISIAEVNEPTEEIDVDKKKYDNKAEHFEDKPEQSNLSQLVTIAKGNNKKLLLNSPETTSTSPEKQDKSNFGTDNVHSLILTPKVVKEAQLYFTAEDKVVPKDILISKSPSIVRDDATDEYTPSVAVKKILGESFTKPEIISSSLKERLAKKQDSLDIFESPLSSITKACSNNISSIEEIDNKNPEEHIDEINAEIISVTNLKEKAGKIAHEFIESLVGSQKIKAYVKREELELMKSSVNKESTTDSIKNNNAETNAKNKEKEEIKQENITLERTYFTEITKEKNQGEKEIKQEDITLDRTSLPNTTTDNIQHNNDYTTNINQPMNDTQTSKGDNTVDEFEKIVKDLTNVRATDFELLVTHEDISLPANDTLKQDVYTAIDNNDTKEKTEMSEQTKKFEETKYNLRRKEKLNINVRNYKEELEQTDQSSKKRPLRSLRLRKRRNDEYIDQDTDKIKNIMNLKIEFSDVTMGLPAAKKDVKDIPSPEKMAGEEENIPPAMGIQSCPSKSVIRSRRKLFTPRAEPLEESPGHTGDNSNERLYVPRPSYHKTRVRRRL